MPTKFILYQAILILAGLPAGLCVGWFYQKDQIEAKNDAAHKASFFATCVMPYFSFVPLFWMFGQLAFAFAGFMVLSLITSYYSTRHVREASR